VPFATLRLNTEPSTAPLPTIFTLLLELAKNAACTTAPKSKNTV